jgi:tRNA G18 (ribose-2'-O)-methylase SpoU
LTSNIPDTDQEWKMLYEKLLASLGDNFEFADERLFDDESVRQGEGVVILDNIRTPYNVGGIMRSAEAFGLDMVAMCGITPTTDNAKVCRCAMNAPIKTRYFESTSGAINRFREEGFVIAAIEKTKQSIDIDKLNLPDKKHLAIIMGNEEFGVDQSILELSDYIVHIPLTGTKNSLNVCSAAAVAMYKLFGR